MGEAASSDEEDLPAMSAEGSGPRAAIDAAETATDYSKKHSKMRPATDFAAASDYVAIDPFVVFPGESWIPLHSDSAVAANYSTCC
mmetsp:Transcript_21977/g.37591  ORF Transcript_21977/g.37591 Transcript_21977/m.37591 type:complete len:86 (-) Transcript_21977:388-645(-)